jgi:type II secretory pathway pseudopilin PulG
LLVVIAIIAILMALLFPAIQGVKNQAHKAEAASHVNGICAAVKSYYTEYGQYPNAVPAGSTPPTTPQDTVVGDTAAGMTNYNNLLFDILRNNSASSNVSYAQNPRQIVFFDGKQAANPTTPKSGFMDSSAGTKTYLGCFFDPWGKQYNVVMDTMYQNAIVVNNYYTDFAAPNNPKVGVGAFSMGLDNKLGNNGNKQYMSGSTKSDDVISWQ